MKVNLGLAYKFTQLILETKNTTYAGKKGK